MSQPQPPWDDDCVQPGQPLGLPQPDCHYSRLTPDQCPTACTTRWTAPARKVCPTSSGGAPSWTDHGQGLGLGRWVSGTVHRIYFVSGNRLGSSGWWRNNTRRTRPTSKSHRHNEAEHAETTQMPSPGKQPSLTS